MSYIVSITQEQLYEVLSTFLQSVSGLGQSLVIQGLPNRTAMPPAAPGFVTMQLTRAGRLNYNIVTWDTTNPAPTEISVEVHVMLRLQVDFYGATSGDWATIFAALWKDETACLALEPLADPLYANEEMLAPLEDDEQQYEQRWTIEAFLQYNPVVTVPMQFANVFTVTLINVDETYPP
jgi:hypothetical protein